MKQNLTGPNDETALCGQAQAVSEILSRTESLPTGLSLTIEEILERAWEIAYRRQARERRENVIVVRDWADRRLR